MKKRWIFIGAVVICSLLLGLWINRKGEESCRACFQKEPQFFQLFSAPTSDSTTREKKFLSFIEQTYPFFRVAVTAEEAVYPEVQAIIEKFPERFATLPKGYDVPELFYRWIHSIPPGDIVVLFPPDGALEASALDRLKSLYRGSAAWLGFQGDTKRWAENGVLSGYASLFQKIKLQDFLEKGVFSKNKTPENRLFELAGKHVRKLRGGFIQGKQYGYSWIGKSRHPYARFRPSSEQSQETLSDLVIFSFDRPLQLFALLESTDRLISSLDRIAVIYRTSSLDFEKGYDDVKKQFPHVCYLKQGDHPEYDFKPLVLEATFKSPSRYVMFAVDDLIVRDAIDIKHGIDQMERAGALGVYYHLGRHVELNQEQPTPPPSIRLENSVWAWQFSEGEGDWKYPHTVDMTLYRKEDIKKVLTSLHYTHPNSMESRWALKAKMGGMGIYYDTSKVINIPYTDQYTTQELLDYFLKGLKIDIKPFQGFEDRSAHVDIPMIFIEREKTIR